MKCSQQLARRGQPLRRLYDYHAMDQIGQRQFSLQAGNTAVLGILLEGCGSEQALHSARQAAGRLTLHQNPGLYHVMKPVPGGNARQLSSLAIASSSFTRGESPVKKSSTSARIRKESKVARSAGMPSIPPGTDPRNNSSWRINSMARAVRPAFTTATGFWFVSKTRIRNRWPSLAGFPARIPKVGTSDVGILANEARSFTKASSADSVRAILSVPTATGRS